MSNTWWAVLGATSYEIEPQSLTVEHRIDDRTAPRFELRTEDGIHFTKGQPVTIHHTSGRLFAGQVWSVAEHYWGATDGLVHQITCVDFHVLADRRYIARGYTAGATLGSVVTDIISILAADGVTAGTVTAGGTLAEDSGFNYVSCSQAMDALAELAGFWWVINDDKELSFRPYDAAAAPWDVAPTGGVLEDVEAGTFQMVRSAPDYRNRQLLRGVRSTTDAQTETFAGDGKTGTFTVGFLIATKPTVTVDAVSKTVGIRGLETGFDWYWNKGDRTITQDDAGTVLTSANTLSVTYVGFFDSVLVSHDQDAITERVGVEGGSGIWDHVAEGGQDVSGRPSGFDLIGAKLALFAQVGTQVVYRTDRSGLAAGQLQTVTAPRHGLDGLEVLIESVTVVPEGDRRLFEVVATAGPLERSWTRFFGEIARQPRLLVFRENISEDEVLTRLFSQSKTWDDVDVQPANFWYEVWPAAALATSASLYPQIGRDDWVRYVEWWDSTAAVGRKQVTSRTLTASEIESTFYLAPFEANIAFVSVKFYGGAGATDTLESGDLAVTVALAETKTSAEAWQITRTDTRAGTPLDWWEIGDLPV